MEQSSRLQKALNNLRKSNEFLGNINKHMAIAITEETEEELGKSLGKNRAPQKRPTKIVSSAAFEGHIGTGMRPSAKSTMANKIIASMMNGSPSSANGASSFPAITFYEPSKSSGTAKEDWQSHPHCSIGSFAFIQHPYKHQNPVWARIIAIGKHGIQGSDTDGGTHNVRWPHIVDIQSTIGHGIHPAEDKEVVFELHKMGAPLERDAKLSHSDLIHAEEYLRQLNLPIISDLIHGELADSGSAYDELRTIHAPLDPIAMTEDITGKNSVVPAHLQELIDELSSMGKPIDVEKLSKLPKKDILKVLEHYFKDAKI